MNPYPCYSTETELRDDLIYWREQIIQPNTGGAPRDEGLLRRGMIDEFVRGKPTNVYDVLRGFPQNLIRGTAEDQLDIWLPVLIDHLTQKGGSK